MVWSNFLKGLVIGVSNVLPGVSGGTIALLLGIYDRLIFAINHLFSKKWKDQLPFLLSVGAGLVVATFLFANVIDWLFEQYPQQIQFAFIGLIIGSLPLLLKQSGLKQTINGKYVFLLIFSVIIAASLKFFSPAEATIITEMTPGTYLFLLFAGFIASSSMILPGISGSLMLLLIGAYGTIIRAVTVLQIDILIVTAIGIGLGVVVMSKVISYFLKQYPVATYAMIIGFVIGSLSVIFPGWPTNGVAILSSAGAFLIGLTLAYLLGLAKQKEETV